VSVIDRVSTAPARQPGRWRRTDRVRRGSPHPALPSTRVHLMEEPNADTAFEADVGLPIVGRRCDRTTDVRRGSVRSCATGGLGNRCSDPRPLALHATHRLGGSSFSAGPSPSGNSMAAGQQAPPQAWLRYSLLVARSGTSPLRCEEDRSVGRQGIAIWLPTPMGNMAFAAGSGGPGGAAGTTRPRTRGSSYVRSAATPRWASARALTTSVAVQPARNLR
jgi:hypothetical protein